MPSSNLGRKRPTILFFSSSCGVLRLLADEGLGVRKLLSDKLDGDMNDSRLALLSLKPPNRTAASMAIQFDLGQNENSRSVLYLKNDWEGLLD